MLTASETIGLKEILFDISDEDIFSILDTVTKKMFATKNRDTAIERILSCTEKPSDLLRRQKVTKKVLFGYLLKKNENVSANKEKNCLVKMCLKYWGSQNHENEESDFIEMEQQASPASPSNETVQMGVQFAQWFFPLLNRLEGFGPQHFWDRCTLQAQLFTPHELKEESLSDSMSTATFLSNLILLDKYQFHPNNSEDSILVEEEEHGLVKIVIRGVLHQHSTCVGLFDFAFGLIRHPLQDNTYKIQLVKLLLQTSTGTPRYLPESGLTQICC